MNKKRLFLVNIIISFVLIVSAVVVSLTAGIKLGSDIGGGTMFEVKIEGNVAAKEDIRKIKNVLKHNGESYETIFVEDKNVDTVIVVKIADKKIEKQAQITKQIAEKLEIEETDISQFRTFSGSISKRAVLYASITIVCLLLFVFVAGWIRYGIVSGLSIMFAILHSFMLGVSLFIVTRLPITIIAITMMLVAQVALVFALVLMLEKIHENAKLKHNENLSAGELISVSFKSMLKPVAFLGIMSLVVALTMVCVPVRMVTLSACALIICLVTCAYSFYFIWLPVHEKLVELKANSDKLKLSRNVSPAPQKSKTKKTNKDENK